MRTRLLAFALLLFAAAAGVLTAGDKSMSYLYKRGDSSYMRMNASIDRIGAVAKKYGNEFVWVRSNGRSYVIRDAATLAEVRSAFGEVDAMEPSLREAEKRLKPFEKQMEAIETRVDAFGDQLDDENLGESTRDAIEAKLRDAEDALRGVERQMAGVERETERLERESEKREEAAEERFERIVERAIESGVAERAD
jgi:predicted  nucleic acid-binding Zn-ribbon protein